MKKILLFLAFCTSYSFASKNGNEGIVFLGEKDGSIFIKFNPSNLKFTSITTPKGPEHLLTFDNGTPLLKAGAPDIYKLTASVIIPDFGDMEAKVISSAGLLGIPSAVAPSKGNLKRNVNPSDVPYTYGPEYYQDAFFPGEMVTLSKPFILRDYRALTVTVFPNQFNPVTKQLNSYSEIIVEIKPKGTSSGVNEFNRTTDIKINDTEFDAIYKNLFINYSAHKNSNTRYTAVSENGSMLVICHDAFASDIQPFITWKNKKGIQTDLVLTSQIAGSVTSTDIKNYIANYYTTHPTLKYVLLVGDAPQIPASVTQHGDSDNDYGYLSGNDSYPELFIGRFSATTSSEVQIMVNRTVRYEQFPTLNSNLYKKGITIASNQGPGDDNEMDFEHQLNLKAQMMGFTYNDISENYDGSQGGLDAPGNPTATSIANQINNGVGIITYTGHGSSLAFSTSGFSSSTVGTLTNTNMHPFVWSVACSNGDFVNGNCFAEAFTRAGTPAQPTGALATLMSTILQSWDPPMEGQDEMVNILVESAANNIKRTFGGLSMNGCMQMNDAYGTMGDEMTDTWTCFGDPSVMVYTDAPANMTVSHVASVPLATTSITINCNINDALICLSKNGVILGTGIAAGGSATITIPAATAGIIDVTATAFNKMPYMGTITVGANGINEYNNNLIAVYPNPANDILNVTFINNNENQKISIYNELGQVALTASNENAVNYGTSLKQINIQSLPAGIYFLKVESENYISTKYFVIQR